MKYKFTGETKEYLGRVLKRIVCVEPFGHVKRGELGGWIETEENLSQLDEAWVSREAIVYGNAAICSRAMVLDHACVYGNACITGDAKICGQANVYDNALVLENGLLHGNAKVYGDAIISGNAKVCNKAEIFDRAKVSGDSVVCAEAIVSGSAQVYGEAFISGDATIRSTFDYAVYKNTWSSNRYFTWTRSNNMWRAGCFYGTGEQLVDKAYKDSQLSGDCYKAVVEMRNRLTELEDASPVIEGRIRHSESSGQ